MGLYSHAAFPKVVDDWLSASLFTSCCSIFGALLYIFFPDLSFSRTLSPLRATSAMMVTSPAASCKTTLVFASLTPVFAAHPVDRLWDGRFYAVSTCLYLLLPALTTDNTAWTAIAHSVYFLAPVCRYPGYLPPLHRVSTCIHWLPAWLRYLCFFCLYRRTPCARAVRRYYLHTFELYTCGRGLPRACTYSRPSLYVTSAAAGGLTASITVYSTYSRWPSFHLPYDPHATSSSLYTYTMPAAAPVTFHLLFWRV